MKRQPGKDTGFGRGSAADLLAMVLALVLVRALVLVPERVLVSVLALVPELALALALAQAQALALAALWVLRVRLPKRFLSAAKHPPLRILKPTRQQRPRRL